VRAHFFVVEFAAGAAGAVAEPGVLYLNSGICCSSDLLAFASVIVLPSGVIFNASKGTAT